METLPVDRDPEGVELHKLRRYAGSCEGSPQGLLPADRVLEIGAGNGRLIWKYGKAVAQVVGIDTEAAKLREALETRPEGLAETSSFLLAQAEALPFSSASFDLTILGWSL